MSFFHHGEKPHEEPRVVLNEQPSTDTKQTVSAGNDAGNVGDSMTKATYDAVTAGLAQHGTAAESAANPPVTVDMSVQTLNAEGNVAGESTHSDAAATSEIQSNGETPQTFDPSPRVDPSDPNAVSEPVGPEKPMIAPHTEVDAFGLPIVKAKPETDAPSIVADTTEEPTSSLPESPSMQMSSSDTEPALPALSESPDATLEKIEAEVDPQLKKIFDEVDEDYAKLEEEDKSDAEQESHIVNRRKLRKEKMELIRNAREFIKDPKAPELILYFNSKINHKSEPIYEQESSASVSQITENNSQQPTQ